MATSGSTNYSQTRNETILDAFQLAGIYGIGKTISAEDLTFANSLLNKMIKAWGAKGLHVWTFQECVLYLKPNIASYSLGNASTDAHVTSADDEIMTQLNGAHAAAATSITVDSTTGMTVSDEIGIVTSDKDIHWTTISAIGSSTTLTITTGLDSAASDNAYVFTYTNKVSKPNRILNARLRSGMDSGSTSTETDIFMSPIGYNLYQSLPAKSRASTNPIQYAYQPQLTNGLMYVYPRPSDSSNRICFTAERLLNDMDSTSDNFDFPAEWLETLTYQLAVRLCTPFGKSQKLQELLPLASRMLDDLISWDNEVTSVYVSADVRNY